MLWAASCLCFFGFLCSGQAVSPPASQFVPKTRKCQSTVYLLIQRIPHMKKLCHGSPESTGGRWNTATAITRRTQLQHWAATTVALVIKMLGRWQSEAYTLYIRISPVALREASRRLGASNRDTLLVLPPPTRKGPCGSRGSRIAGTVYI